MLDTGDAYTKVPFFFSDQYDLGMEYFGLHEPGDRLVIRGSLDAGSFQAFWVRSDESVSAAMHANDWDASEAIAGLVETGEPGPAALSAAEPSLPSELPPVA